MLLYLLHVCNNCYDESIISCVECGIDYEVWYKGNKRIFNEDCEYFMDICDKKDCSNYMTHQVHFSNHLFQNKVAKNVLTRPHARIHQ